MKKDLIIGAAVLLAITFMGVTACEKDPAPSPDSLASYVNANPDWVPYNQLVACAAGGQEGFLDDPSAPVSMFFYPKLFSTNFKYYETEGETVDTGNLSLYIEKEVSLEPLFNGFMARFPLARPDSDRWARVSFVSNDTLWYCKPVRLKINEDPTVFAPNLVDVSIRDDFQPDFTWQRADDPNTIIYFQIVVDERGDAVSATYTEDKMFSFYELDNVVFNVTRPGPVLPLQRDQQYSFILMGISDINWVETISQQVFRTD